MSNTKLTEQQLNSEIQNAIDDIQTALRAINALDHLGALYSLRGIASRLIDVRDKCEFELDGLQST